MGVQFLRFCFSPIPIDRLFPMVIWCNTVFNPDADRQLREFLKGHTVILPESASRAVLDAGEADPALLDADIAFGQPDVGQLMSPHRLRWVQLSSAGYSRYDRDDLRTSLQARNVPLTTSSNVFAESCSQHLLAMMLAQARQLPFSLVDQMTNRGWAYDRRRYDSRLMTGQSVLIFGYGTIARRLVDLLAPFKMDIAAVRRTPTGDEGVKIVAPADIGAELAKADHVVNVLPLSPATDRYFDAAKFAAMKPDACFYNVGRGPTVDQEAIRAALEAAKLGFAYLDVTEPEPLPPDHPLWSTKNCFITPHTAGGRRDQDEALVQHFLDNLARLERGEPLANRVI